MNQKQSPKQEKQCEQEQRCCCFCQLHRCGIIKGIVLMVLGLFIAMPTLGHYFGITQSNFLAQYYHIFLGSGFIGWGAAGVIAGLVRRFLKNKNKN
jgi:hypothetical protein